jgi:hypothetical protein
MFDDDADFVVDGDGNRVLIGLTVDETIEFNRLERHINETGPFPFIPREEWLRSEESAGSNFGISIKLPKYRSCAAAIRDIECYGAQATQ